MKQHIVRIVLGLVIVAAAWYWRAPLQALWQPEARPHKPLVGVAPGAGSGADPGFAVAPAASASRR